MSRVPIKIYLSKPILTGDEDAHLKRVLDSGWIAPLGVECDSFEEELAKYTHRQFALCTNSGTSALHLALRVLGVTRGDIVLTSSFTFIGSVSPIHYLGASPVFIDSDERTWNLCPLVLEEALTELQKQGRQAKALIVTDLYGQSADWDRIQEIAKRFGLPIVEDAAEALGAKYHDRPCGSFGDISILSFNGNKIITTSGGGMLLTDVKEYRDKAFYLATQARSPAAHYEHEEIGYNYRLSNVLAALGRAQFANLEFRVRRKREIFNRYVELLKDSSVSFMPEPEGFFSTRWLTTILLPSQSIRDSIMAQLAEQGIESRPLWKPMHIQPVFSGANFYSHQDLDYSSRIFMRGLCLPSGIDLKEEDQSEISEVIKRAL